MALKAHPVQLVPPVLQVQQAHKVRKVFRAPLDCLAPLVRQAQLVLQALKVPRVTRVIRAPQELRAQLELRVLQEVKGRQERQVLRVQRAILAQLVRPELKVQKVTLESRDQLAQLVLLALPVLQALLV